MESKFKDKVVIVTGSAQGIGKHVAKLFLSYGAKVVFVDVNKPKLKELKESTGSKKTLFIEADLTIPKDCESLMKIVKKQFGKIDVLINNAGIGFRGRFEDTSVDALKKTIDINLMTAMYCTKYALGEIIKTQGSIVFLSSTAGLRGIPFYGPYSVAKIGLRSFAEVLQIELSKKNVHVGVMILGPTETEKEKKILNAEGVCQSFENDHKLISLDEAAKKIVECVEKRKKVMVITYLSKMIYYLNRISPVLVSFILKIFNRPERFK